MIYYLSHAINTGFLSDEHKKELGSFSWWENLRMGGIGSPRAKYQSGISGFDVLLKETQDTLHINFELTKKALLIRAWLRNDCFVAYVFYTDISFLKIENQTIHISLKEDKTPLLFSISYDLEASFSTFFKKTATFCS